MKQMDVSGLAVRTAQPVPPALQIVAVQGEQGEQLYQYPGAAVLWISDGAAGRSGCWQPGAES